MKARRSLAGAGLLVVVLLTSYSYHGDIPVEELRPLYANESSRFVDVDGMPVHYRIEGEGPTLLLLHGTNSSLHTWDGWTNELSADFRVVRLDLPGYGLTGPDREERYTAPEVARFLRRFADAVGLETFAIAGNSRGGAVAWNYACLFSEQVTALVLIDSAGLPRDEPMPFILRLQGLPALRMVTSRLTPRLLVEKGARDVYGDPSMVDEATVDRYFELLLREGNRGAVAAMTSEGEDWGDPRCLEELNVPTFLQWGELDRWIPPRYGQQFEDAIVGSRLRIYPGLGHIPMEEAPESTAADVRRFLSEVAAE